MGRIMLVEVFWTYKDSKCFDKVETTDCLCTLSHVLDVVICRRNQLCYFLIKSCYFRYKILSGINKIQETLKEHKLLIEECQRAIKEGTQLNDATSNFAMSPALNNQELDKNLKDDAMVSLSLFIIFLAWMESSSIIALAVMTTQSQKLLL